jgi:hypothetical protein
MGLDIYYKKDNVYYPISKDNDFSNPFTTVHDGKTGDTKTNQLYVRNDDNSEWFSNIVITPDDGETVYTETGWGVKLSAGADEPTKGQWDDIAWGRAINMPDVGLDSVADIATYYPFWILVTCPPNTDAQIKTDIRLRVDWTENSIL